MSVQCCRFGGDHDNEVARDAVVRYYDVCGPASSTGPGSVPLVVDAYGLGGNKKAASSQEVGASNHE